VDLGPNSIFPQSLFDGAVVGIERIEGKTREVEVEREVEVVERWQEWKSRKTGRFVSAKYAKRYRHLVKKVWVKRVVVRVEKVKEEVPQEEAVIRFTYEAGFTVSETPEIGQ
jgi:hypothetical protein